MTGRDLLSVDAWGCSSARLPYPPDEGGCYPPPMSRPSPRRGPRMHRSRWWPALIAFLVLVGDADADRRAPAPSPLPHKEIAERDRSAHKEARRLPASTNALDEVGSAAEIAVSAPTKVLHVTLQRRWLEHRDDIRGSRISVEPYADRGLSRYFANTEFYRLEAARGDHRIQGIGAECMGEALILPDEINLLCILEGRHLNRHNVRPLAELIVHMADPSHGGRQRVEEVVVSRDDADAMDEVVLTTWAYEVGLRRRWTIDIREPYFYTMEEKLLAFRPEIMRNLDPGSLREDDVGGPATGDERYVTFWRDRNRRDRMEEVRETYLEERRARRKARSRR